MNDLGQATRELIDAARGGEDPLPGDKARMGMRLAQLGVGAAVMTTMTATAAAGAVGSAAAKGTAIGGASAVVGASAVSTGLVSSAGALAVKVVLAVALAGAVSVAGVKGVNVYRATRAVPVAVASGTQEVSAQAAPGGGDRAAASPTPLTAVPAVAAVGAEEPVGPVAPLPRAPQPSRAIAGSLNAARQVRAPSVAVRPGAATENPLDAETRLLRDAEALRQAGNGAGALALLDEHAARFPYGILAEERSAARVFALCDVGRVADATDEARRFLAERPHSPAAPHVRTSCVRGSLP